MLHGLENDVCIYCPGPSELLLSRPSIGASRLECGHGLLSGAKVYNLWLLRSVHQVLYFDYVMLHKWMLSAVYEHCTIGDNFLSLLKDNDNLKTLTALCKQYI